MSTTNQNISTIGWIGMGRMGYAMAERLLQAGNDVSVWNRTQSKAEPLVAQGAKLAQNPSDRCIHNVIHLQRC